MRHRLRCSAFWILAVGTALGTVVSSAGCAGAPVAGALPEATAAGEYRIGLDDVLEVAVWRDPDLSRTVPVRPDGKISLPLVGELPAAGKTARELERELALRLAPFIRTPRVSVIVKEINAPRIFVMGQVLHPGAFPLRSPVTILQALAEAGGLAEFADQNSIVLLRHTGESVHRYSLRYDDLLEGKPERTVFLSPGDTLVVP